MASYELRIFKNADTLRWACERIRSSLASSEDRNKFAINGMLAKVAQDPEHVLRNPVAKRAFLKMVGNYASALTRDARLFGEPGFGSTPSGRHPKIFQIDIGDRSLFLDDRSLNASVTDMFGSQRFIELTAPFISGHMTLKQMQGGDIAGYKRAFRDVKTGSTVLVAHDSADFRTFILQNLFPEHATVALLPTFTIDDRKLSERAGPYVNGGYVMKKLPEGAWLPLGSILSYAEGREINIDRDRVKGLIRNIREISYVTRELGLSFDPGKQVRIDFATGRVITVPGGPIDVIDASLLADEYGEIHRVCLPYDEGLLDVEAVYVPNTGVRAFGEELLSAAAEKILNEILRMGGDARDWSTSSYPEIIGGLIDSFGEVDAMPHLEGIFREWRARGEIGKAQRKLALAAYEDYLFAHAERRLQFMAGIKPRLDDERTLNAAMRALLLTLSLEVVPPELKGRREEADVFVEARKMLRYLASYDRTATAVKGVLGTYLRTHGIEGLSWFVSMVLPLVALGSKESAFAMKAMRVIHVFEPSRRFSWNAYANVAAWVGRAIDPRDDDPKGTLRPFTVHGSGPEPVMPPSSEPPKGEVNVAAVQVLPSGGALLYGIPLRIVSR